MGKMDKETLNMITDTIDRIENDRLPLEKKLEIDSSGKFPEELIRFMLGPEVALHLVFIPEEYGGLGAEATEIAVISERMAKMDLAIATSFLAICLGMDPLRVGATERQKERYMKRIADEGLIVAYAVTEPNAGSNVQAIKTRAERVFDEKGNIKGYRLNGQKQFITNGGVADLYTILANTPEGPSFFIVERGAEGLIPGSHEDKHGIRGSNTCPITIEDLYVPAEDLVGEVEGRGLRQANEVFGYTRLMVATFGLGGGMASLERAIRYSKERVQFGTTLSEKQGYTHRLLVPNAVRLEAARAYIEQTATRLDSGEKGLQVEGSIAKYFATEAGDSMANDGIQALGGYGYIREYEMEKIKRDIKITTIFEGTNEIQRNIIATFRMRENVKTKGGFYMEKANKAMKPGDRYSQKLALSLEIIGEIIGFIRRNKLTRQQHLMFLLADMITWTEVGEALLQKVRSSDTDSEYGNYLNACLRLFLREVAEIGYVNGLKILSAGKDSKELKDMLFQLDIPYLMKGYLDDMDIVCSYILENYT